jgi:hypothetical protein
MFRPSAKRALAVADRDQQLSLLFNAMEVQLPLGPAIAKARESYNATFARNSACVAWMQKHRQSDFAYRFRWIWKSFDGGLAPGLDI